MACIFKKKILPEGKMRTREIGLIIRTKGRESFPITIKIQYFKFYINIDSLITILIPLRLYHFYRNKFLRGFSV